MEILTWTPVIFSRKGFPVDDSGNPFLPKNSFVEAISSAAIFYYVKKDKEIENKVKNYLLKENLNIKTVVENVKNIVLSKYPILDKLEIPEKIYLPKEYIKEEYVEIFDLKEWIDIKGFKTQIFKGEIQLEISSPFLSDIKSACHSYAEALARMEKSLLKDHPLVEEFYNPLINDLKQWEIPLRLGMWTEVSFKGNLLFFWKIKEVREKIMKELKVDIRPRYVLYLPREKQTTGWVEIKN